MSCLVQDIFVLSVVDKCACAVYNMNNLNRRYKKMTAKLSTLYSSYMSRCCTSSATDCTSARIVMNLGTALLAVSIIIIIRVINILVLYP